MKKKILAVLLTAGMAASLFAGCGDSSSEGSSTSSGTSEASSEAGDSSSETAEATGDEEYNIAVILKTISSEYWGYVQAGAEAYEADHPNVHVDVLGGSSETAYDEQNNIIETVVNSGEYDAMAVAALQEASIPTLVGDSDIPVIAIDQDISYEDKVCFIGTGNEEAAAQGAQAAIDLAKERGWEDIEVVVIQGVQGDPTMEARTAGFKRGTEEAGATYLADEIQYADSVADKAVTAMEGIMQQHPEGIAVICCGNDDMAIAAARAAQGNEAFANTVFCGFDGIQSACEAIIAGDLTMSVAQSPYNEGYTAVETCVAVLNGESVDEVIDTGSDVITEENAQEHLDELKGYLGE